MSNGTRYNGNTIDPTDLTFNFLLNGKDYAPYSADKVEIYGSYDDAENNNNILETIPTGDIVIDDSNSIPSVNSTCKYTADVLPVSATYFDKIYITPRDGMTPISFINSFFIQEYNWGGSTPSDHQRIRVYLNIFDIMDNPQKNAEVVWRLNVKDAWYGKDFIKQEKEIFKADDNGLVTMDIVETDTLLKDTFDLTDPNNPTPEELKKLFYRVEIDGRAKYDVRVPKGIVSAQFKDLPEV